MSRTIRPRANAKLTTAVVALALVVAACSDTQGQRIAELEGQLAEVEEQLESAGYTPDGLTFDEPVALSIETLAGIWLLDGKGTLLSFSEDGTYAFDDRGNLDTNPRDAGTYELDGSTLTLISGEDGFCQSGDIFVWEDVGLVEIGRMVGTVVTDDCSGAGSALIGVDWTWTIISPRRASTPA